MRRVWVVLAAGLVLATCLFTSAWSQSSGSDFSTLFARWQQEQDVEQRISLGETLLTEAPALSPWPLSADRTQVITELQFGIASAYVNRPTGVRANRER